MTHRIIPTYWNKGPKTVTMSALDKWHVAQEAHGSTLSVSGVVAVAEPWRCHVPFYISIRLSVPGAWHCLRRYCASCSQFHPRLPTQVYVMQSYGQEDLIFLLWWIRQSCAMLYSCNWYSCVLRTHHRYENVWSAWNANTSIYKISMCPFTPISSSAVNVSMV
jgi:hypothetical protein